MVGDVVREAVYCIWYIVELGLDGRKFKLSLCSAEIVYLIKVSTRSPCPSFILVSDTGKHDPSSTES
jgi:hypothetical protein